MLQDEQAQGRIDPWFLRTTDYVGIGPGVAWQEARQVPLGQTLEIALDLLLLDRQVSLEEVPELLAAAATAPTEA